MHLNWKEAMIDGRWKLGFGAQLTAGPALATRYRALIGRKSTMRINYQEPDQLKLLERCVQFASERDITEDEGSNLLSYSKRFANLYDKLEDAELPYMWLGPMSKDESGMEIGYCIHRHRGGDSLWQRPAASMVDFGDLYLGWKLVVKRSSVPFVITEEGQVRRPEIGELVKRWRDYWHEEAEKEVSWIKSCHPDPEDELVRHQIAFARAIPPILVFGALGENNAKSMILVDKNNWELIEA